MDKKGGDDDFSSKAQIMTLMTTDVDRVSEFAWHIFSLVGEGCDAIGYPGLCLNVFLADSPIEIVIGTIFLYKLLGKSLRLLYPAKILTATIARCIMFFRTCSNMPIPSDESLRWESGRWLPR